MEIGTITINLEGVSLEDTERCRRILHSLIEWGVLTVFNSKCVLHFGPKGELEMMERTVFHRKPPLRDSLERAKGEVQLNHPIPNSTKSGQPIR